MQPVEDMMEQPPEQQPLENIVVQFAEEPVENMMELLYITDGVIPFLSELCQQMSNLSSKEDICSTEELQSVGEKLALVSKAYNVIGYNYYYRSLKTTALYQKNL